MKIIQYLMIALAALLISSCNNQKKSEQDFPGRDEALQRVNPEDFISEIDGKETKLFTLENRNGVIVRLTNYGASMVQVIAPDRDGKFDDIILGYNSIEGYVNDKMHQGRIVGRYANRIAKGKFMLNGKEYNLSLNDGPNSLHGGFAGLGTKVWDAEEVLNGVKFSVVSQDMEEGYPGELKVTVIYTLNDRNEIRLEYSAQTSDSTFINLTNHTYWNLNGEAETDILGHELKIDADYITPVDTTLIPTGVLMDVSNSPFDFREFMKIGERINDANPQIMAGGGYDHNFVLSMDVKEQPREAASLYSEKSGRLLEIFTTEPGIQVYSGNFMNGTVTGKNNMPYKYRHAIALETQHFPDSPNHPDFPSTLLIPGDTYSQITVFKVSVKE